MISSNTAFCAFLLAAALGATSATDRVTNPNPSLQFSLPEITVPNCNGSGDDDSREPICTVLNCIDAQTGSFTCHCSVVVEAIERLGMARSSIPGISEDQINEVIACCPRETSTVDFSMCMMNCDATPDDPICEILECTDPFTGAFTCQCDMITDAFAMIPNAGEKAEFLGITEEMVNMAVECCPVGTVLDTFQKCYDAIQPGLFLPGVDDASDGAPSDEVAENQPTTSGEDEGADSDGVPVAPPVVTDFDNDTPATKPNADSDGEEDMQNILVDGIEDTPPDNFTGTQTALPEDDGLNTNGVSGAEPAASDEEEDVTSTASVAAGWSHAAALALVFSPFLLV